MREQINNTAEIRSQNKKKILEFFIQHETSTKKALASSLKLSFATVSNLCNQLIMEGILQISAYQDSEGGRSAGLISLLENSRYYFAVDFSHLHHITVALINLKGTFVWEKRIDLQSPYGIEEFMSACKNGITTCLGELNLENNVVLGVGISLPGILDPKDGCLVNSTVPALEGQKILFLIQKELQLPTYMENESNLLALAVQSKSQKLFNNNDIIYIYIDDGLGIGIICNGKLVKGSNGFGGEINHFPIGVRKYLCSCGQQGCLETELSINGFLMKYREESQTKEVDWKNFVEQLKAEAPAAIRVVKENGELLGKALSMLSSLFDPIEIHIGGTIEEIFYELQPYAMKELYARSEFAKVKQAHIFNSNNHHNLLLTGCGSLVFEKWNP